MKRKILFITALFLLLFFDVPFAQIAFQKIYYGAVMEAASSVKQTSDSGYIICGFTRSYGAGFDDVYLIKTDVNGDTLWTKTYGSTGAETGRCVQQTFDGGYIVAAIGAGVFLIKTDANGDTLWTRAVQDSIDMFNYGSWASSIEQTTDSGYIITGGSCGHVLLLKTDSNGNVLWKKLFGGQNWTDLGRFVEQTSDGGYIITGHTYNFNSFGGTVFNTYLIKTNFAGDTLWSKTYYGNDNAEGFCVQQTFDAGYILAGRSSQYPGKLFLIKTNSTGDTLWTRLFSSSAFVEGYSVQQTSDSGFVVAGTIENVAVNQPYALIIKTNVSGDTLWTRTFGLAHVSSSGESANSIQQTIDGGYIIAASAVILPGPDVRAYLIKTDANGNGLCNEFYLPISVSHYIVQVGSPATISFSSITTYPSYTTIVSNGCIVMPLCSTGLIEESTFNTNFIISPNPNNGTFQISSIENRLTCIEIYNVLGKKVYSDELITYSKEQRINFHSPPGIYLVKVYYGEKFYCKKIIIERD